MAIGSGRGRGITASWERFLVHGFVASNPQGKGFNFCFEKRHEFRRNRATIGPRSSHGRALIFVVVDRRMSSGRLGAIPPLKEHDRGSIAPRSRFDRAAIEPFFHPSSLPSYEDLIVMTIPTVRWRSDAPGGSTRVEKVANDCGRPMMIG